MEKGFSETSAQYINMICLLLAVLIIAVVVDFITKRFLWRFSTGLAKRTKTNFDDILISNKLPRNIAHIIPLIILIEFVPQVFTDFEYAEDIIEKTLKVIAVILTLRIIRSFLNSIKDYLKTLAKYKDKPVDSYIQVFMIFVWILGVFGIFSILTGITFLKFAFTLGTASAVILLIFKDTILGFVASIQVSINDMVRIGDWITFEKYGADATRWYLVVNSPPWRPTLFDEDGFPLHGQLVFRGVFLRFINSRSCREPPPHPLRFALS